MKCVVCHGEDIEIKEIREEIAVGNDVVHVPIKTPVCATCGERYYDRRTMQFLEEVESRIKKTELNLKEIGKVFILEEAPNPT